MKTQKMMLIVVSLLVLFSMLLASCAPAATETAVPPEEAEEPTEAEEPEEPAAEEPTTVEVWFHSGKGEERDVLDAQVKDFNEMQDEIFIDAVQLPELEIVRIALVNLVAGDEDLIRVDLGQIE